MQNLNPSDPPNPNPDAPIPLGDDLDKPIPFDDGGTPKPNISHTPLNLGGGPAAPQARPPQAQRPAAPAAKIQMPQPAASKPVPKAVSTNRISGVKTFFTKLHPGAIQFLDEQICDWLKGNPAVVIKRTNVTTGEVQAKKTEPNLIITVWY